MKNERTTSSTYVILIDGTEIPEVIFWLLWPRIRDLNQPIGEVHWEREVLMCIYNNEVPQKGELRQAVDKFVDDWIEKWPNPKGPTHEYFDEYAYKLVRLGYNPETDKLKSPVKMIITKEKLSET